MMTLFVLPSFKGSNHATIESKKVAEAKPALELYVHSKYRGYGREWSYRTSESDLSDALKNKASSLILREGWTIIMYSSKNFKGSKKILHGTRRIKHLRDEGWNDVISSFELMPTVEYKRAIKRK